MLPKKATRDVPKPCQNAGPSSPLPLVLVAAVARNGVIGGDNRLPWRLSSDLKHFRAVTWGKPLLMGRKTFASIGRPLPGRETIVLTRAADFHAQGVLVARDLDTALDLATQRGRAMGAAEIVVAGGGELYGQLIGRATRLAITEVDLAPQGDIHFPPIDLSVWREAGRQSHPIGPGDEAAFAFVEYARMC
jgi:dihydrofolate reductase